MAAAMEKKAGPAGRQQAGPDLVKWIDKSIKIRVNGGRQLQGVLLGYDQYMNLVVGDAVDTSDRDNQVQVGVTVVRGNAVESLEALQFIEKTNYAPKTR